MSLSGLKGVLSAFVVATSFMFISVNQAIADEYHTTFLGNTAVSGYDTVAYFTLGKAVKGERKHSLEWKKATWRFSSRKHLDMFKADPEKYAPRYGGHCAWAVSEKGMLYRGNPRHWIIFDGGLYLNHNSSVNRRWQEDMNQHIQSGDERWAQIKDKK